MRRTLVAVGVVSCLALAGLAVRYPADAAVSVVRPAGSVGDATFVVLNQATTATHHTIFDANGTATLDGSLQGTLAYKVHADAFRTRSRGTVTATIVGSVGAHTGVLNLSATVTTFFPAGGVVTMNMKIGSATGGLAGVTGNVKVVGGIPASAGPAVYTGVIRIPVPPKPTTTTLPRATTTTMPRVTTTTSAPVIVDDPEEEMVDVSPSGTAAHFDNTDPYTAGIAYISRDGRYVVFQSTATDLVAGDDNAIADTFLRDMSNGVTRRISLAADGSELQQSDLFSPNNGFSAFPAGISPNGRYVALTTSARLLPADTNTTDDLYLLDTTTGSYQLVSIALDGGGSDSQQIALAQISNDGRYVAFQSDATNLVPSDLDPSPDPPFYNAGQPWPDVFVRDMQQGTTTLVSADTDGLGAAGANPSMTPDGHFIAYEGTPNVVAGSAPTASKNAFVYDTTTGTTSVVGIDGWGNVLDDAGGPTISDDGTKVAFQARGPVVPGYSPPAYPEGAAQYFVRDLGAGTTQLATTDGPRMSADREPLNGVISGNGEYMTFLCWCQRVFAAGGPGQGHEGYYRADLSAHTVREIDANASGVVANADVYTASAFNAVTYDGSQAVFGSLASNLVPGDTNDHADVFRVTVT